MAVGARILEDRAEDVDRIEIGEGIADDDLPAERLGAGLQKRDRLRMAIFVDEEGLGLRLRNALGHRHRFSGCGRFIEKRRVGNVEASQVADHGLVVEQRFEAALADFRLVGRIGRVPGRVFQDVALDDRRRDRAVVALADQRHELLVAVGRFAHLVERLALGHRRAPGKRRFLADRRRHGVVDQRIERRVTDDLQHLVHFGRRRADMTPIGEVIRLVVRKGEILGHAHQATSSL